MVIVGVGGLVHDGAVALSRDGKIVSAAEEEKLTRRKYSGGFPFRSLEYCLEMAEVSADDVNLVALTRPLGTQENVAFHLRLKSILPQARVLIVDHHAAHAASAFFASPFETAQVLTLDRRGDSRCGARWKGEQNRLTVLGEVYAPDSPAAFYSRVTELLGFSADAEEHKVQWVSAFGTARFRDILAKVLYSGSDGLPRIDHRYFDLSRSAAGGFSERFFQELGLEPEEVLEDPVRSDLAASLQAVVEDVILRMAGEGGSLCLAGGLAYNAFLVHSLEQSGRFEEVWVQPVAGNAGTALGSALFAWHEFLEETERKSLDHLFLGPEFDAESTKRTLDNCKLRFHRLRTEREVLKQAVSILKSDRILAWFQGRMELGPRALGHRSLLASPLNPYATQNLNQYIKHRESFRRFAASVPAETASEYFETTDNARFLSTVGRCREKHRETFQPALLDGDRLRVHTVHREENRLYWELLHAFGRETGLPVLYNTSFNLFGEPLVCDPRGAVRSFYSSGIDAMLLGDFLLQK